MKPRFLSEKSHSSPLWKRLRRTLYRGPRNATREPWMSLATTTTALNELPSVSWRSWPAICTSGKENKNDRYGTRAIKNLVSKRTKLYDTQVTQPLLEHFPTYRLRGRLPPLSHLMRGQRPTTRNLFSVRCDGWMCQIGDSIDFHEREISRTSQAIAKLLIIGATSPSPCCERVSKTNAAA
jgi:hypothetical protein